MQPASKFDFGLDPRAAVLLDRVFGSLLSVFIFITLFLPSGTVYNVNLKLPLYALLLPLALFRFFRSRQATLPALLRLAGIPALAACWLLIAFIHSVPAAGALRQYTDIVLTFLLCWLVLVFCNDDTARLLRFLRITLLAETATALLKFVIILYALAHGIPVVTLIATLSTVFGVNLMTLDFGALLGRIQFVSDAVIPVCVYTVLRHRDLLRIGNTRASLTILLLLFSVLISFSRYFWVFTALAFVLGLLLGKRDRFQALLLGSLGALLLASLPLVIPLYQLRLSQDVAGYSDDLRTSQSSALKAFFLDAPLFGHGLGSYIPTLLRETDTEAGRYSYELQLLALAGQIGLVGLVGFATLLLWYFRALWWRSQVELRDGLSLGLLLLCWLAAGFYNPLLLNPVASVIYAMLAVLTSVACLPLPWVCRPAYCGAANNYTERSVTGTPAAARLNA